MDAKEVLVKPRLPPGFRFRPTDEELVVHYLRRRAFASALPAAVDIPDIRILAHDPSELLPPGWSEPERYFFTCKEAKYVKGQRANRATDAGYWKATGKEKPVTVHGGGGANQQPVLVGMKRSLVFYRGKPPNGSKSDWVMHEYRLAGAGLAPPCRRAVRRPTEGWVLCRVFRKKRGSSSCASAASIVARRADDDDAEEEGEEEEEGGGRKEDEDTDDAQAQQPTAGFIDFFSRAEAVAAREQRCASSSVVSSSCLTTDAASHELLQLCREQETTSRGA